MADKKLNEVTANATVDYVIGTLNDGSTVRISKDDLAAVVGGLAFPYIKKTNNSSGVLRSKSNVGICIAYDSNKPINYCCVSFGTNVGNNIRVEKISGNLEMGTLYNNQGTWVCDGADSYIVIAV